MRTYNFYEKIDDIKRTTKDTLAGSWNFAAKKTLLFFVMCLLSIAISVVPSVIVPKWYVIAPTVLVSVCLLYLLWYGYQVFCLNLSSKMKASTKDLFAGFSKKTFTLLKLLVCKFFTILLGIVCLVLYGYVFHISFETTSFVLAQNDKIKAIPCMKQSRRLMRDNKKRMLKLDFKNMGWSLLCLTLLGALWALPYITTSKATFYLDLKADF